VRSGSRETRPRQGEGREIEFRLDLIQIALAVTVFGVLVVAWLFFRSPSARSEAVQAGAPPIARVKEEKDISKELTFFDRLESGDRRVGNTPKAEKLEHPGRAAAAPDQLSGARSAPEGRAGESVRQVPVSGSGGDSFSIQVFAGDRKAAERLRGRLAARGYDAYIVPTGRSKARVKVGRYRSTDDAKASASRLAAEGLRTWIVPAP